MAKEFDLVGLASVGGWLKWRRKHADLEPGTPCMNCETPLQGTYCSNCGQLAETFHKSIWHLFMEVLESFFHFDGRLWRTMPALVYKPGQLTSDYINGKRTYQVPPLRLFLVLLVIVFFAGQYGMGGRDADDVDAFQFDGPAGAASTNGRVVTGATARAQARTEIMNDKSMSEADKKAAIAAIDRDWSKFGGALAESIRANSDEAQRRRAAAGKPTLPGQLSPPDARGPRLTVGPSAPAAKGGALVSGNVDLADGDVRIGSEKQNAAITRWVQDRAKAINDDPKRFWMIIEGWAHRIAVLALPISALILTLLFVFQRRFYVFDHLIFSMHSLSFQLLLLSILWVTGRWFGPWVWWFLWLSPVHLFLHMRRTYETGWFLTLVRMLFLFILTTIAFCFLIGLLFYLGLNDMGTT